jgi:SAM-dependent methyltransferase
MTSPSTPHTPENWDAASRGYAAKIAPMMMQTFADDLVDRLDVGPGTEALEVGAGSGALTETLSRRVKSLLATDFAPKMIDLLRQRMQAVGATNVTCGVMDGQALTLEDASFDRAASSFALMLFPDRAKGFSELRRVVRSGGRAVVSGWAGPDKFEAFGIFLEAMRAAFPDLPAPSTPPPVFSLADPADFKMQMEAGGFTNVEVEFVSHDLEVASFDDLWEILTAGAPPLQVLFDRIGFTGRDRLRDALRGIVEQRFSGGSIRLTNAATVGWGTVQ